MRLGRGSDVVTVRSDRRCESLILAALAVVDSFDSGRPSG